MLVEPNYVQIVSKILGLKEFQVERVLKLLSEDCTVAFIARYRKEVTGNLDEDKIREIQEENLKQENLFKAKQTAINGIEKQDKLTPELEQKIVECESLAEVEEIYKPYRLKKKTKAMIALENGFEGVAKNILAQEKLNISSDLLSKFSQDEIIQGAKEIVIFWLCDDKKNKDMFSYFFSKYGVVESSKVTEKKFEGLSDSSKKQAYKFEIYEDFRIDVKKLKSYRILALNRGDDLGLISFKFEKDDIVFEELCEKYIKKDLNQELLKICLKEVFTKLYKSITNQVWQDLTKFAHDESILTFQSNLKKLLLTKPQYQKEVLAIDPGFRIGCKIVILDKNGLPIEFSKIFLHKEVDAKRIFKDLIGKFKVDSIVIGNGTGSNDTYNLIKDLTSIPIFIVNESGASVYSASKVAQEEFPNLDLTDRGTISIGRRYVDPLAELCKIPPQSIGVGMYQHDINQKELAEKLGFVLEDIINEVGINVNSASVYILNYISGLTKASAKKVFSKRPFKSREELRKVLTPKAFEQAAGFLRIKEGSESLDDTNIHPQQYTLAKFVVKNKVSSLNYSNFEVEMKKLYDLVTLDTVNFILTSIKESQKDIRVYDAVKKIDKTLEFEDVSEDDILEGVVRNIMQFGVFVDIGLKNDGLIHISQLADKFVKDPKDIVSIGQNLKVKVIKIDKEHKKVQLSLKDI